MSRPTPDALRIDVVTIFPQYLAPLELSLIGRARQGGLLDIRTWDLRDFTDDRHRTVDDTPYGGGPGLVMLPEPWGRALDAIHPGTHGADGGPESTGHGASDHVGHDAGEGPLIVFPSPSGQPFTQRIAGELADHSWLVFGCGRYEGIDERVWQYAEQQHPGRVRTLSLGDYVLNGGEVAALAMIEAVARLRPGVVGNTESLTQESHVDGLLDYPVYTRPPTWRGLPVPDVLRSGDHQAIARWRHQEQLARTARARPDLLHGSALAGLDPHAPGEIRLARGEDCAELLVLMRACWAGHGHDQDPGDILPLVETLEEVRASLDTWYTWVLRAQGRLIGSVRAAVGQDGCWHIGRLMVAEDLRGRGIGRWLLDYAQAQAPPSARHTRLVTTDGGARHPFIRRSVKRSLKKSWSTRRR